LVLEEKERKASGGRVGGGGEGRDRQIKGLQREVMRLNKVLSQTSMSTHTKPVQGFQKILSLQKSNQSLDILCRKLKLDLNVAKQQAKRRLVELEEANLEIGKLQMQLRKARSDHAQQTAEIQKTKSEYLSALKLAEGELKTKSGEAASLRKENLALSEHVKEQNTAQIALQSSVLRLQDQVSALRAEKSLLKRVILKAKASLDAQAIQLQTYETQLRHSQTRFSELQHQNSSIQTEKNRLLLSGQRSSQQKLDQDRDYLESAQKINELMLEIQILRDAISAKNQENILAGKAIHALKTQNELYQKEIDAILDKQGQDSSDNGVRIEELLGKIQTMSEKG
jgi:hypothetical protein